MAILKAGSTVGGKEIETTEGSAAKVKAHATDSAKHLAEGEREKWNGGMPATGGTFTGPVVAQSNTAYASRQVRNVILSTQDADPSLMQDGDIWMKYR